MSRRNRFLFLLTILLSATTVNAAIIYSAGETVEKVMELPYINEFKIQASDGKWYDSKVGIMHEQFSLFWIPLINYGEERYVLYTDQKIGKYDYTYMDLSKEDIEFLHDAFGLPLHPKLHFWDAWGGKILFLMLVLLLIIGCKKDEHKNNQQMDEYLDVPIR